jgi:superfamily II DNA or RNA helicase
MPPPPLRLAYVLQGVPRTGRVVLLPQLLGEETTTLAEYDVKSMRATLHPLDKAIVQEICAGSQFGQIADGSLARLLPLLAQRRTKLGGKRLVVEDEALVPRIVLQMVQPPAPPEEQPPAAPEEQPPAALEEQPPAALEEQPPVALEEQPPVALEEQPPVALEEQPPAPSEELPATEVHPVGADGTALNVAMVSHTAVSEAAAAAVERATGHHTAEASAKGAKVAVADSQGLACTPDTPAVLPVGDAETPADADDTRAADSSDKLEPSLAADNAGDVEAEVDSPAAPATPAPAKLAAPTKYLIAKPQPSLVLTLRLSHPEDGLVDMDSGRLIAGTQAFFLCGNRAFPVTSPNPWKLADWAREPRLKLREDHLTPAGRDTLVSDLRLAGVPAEDLDVFAVHRGPPERIVLRLLRDERDAKAQGALPQVQAVLDVVYDGVTARLEGNRTESPYLQGKAPQVGRGAGLIERDLMVEDEVRRRLKVAGFRFDKTSGHFIAEEEAALAASDPERQVFPADWEVDRHASSMHFRRDLTLHTEVKMLQERGLLDVHVTVQTEAQSDEQAAQALVDMQELLTWLRSGKRYVRLADGSYAAPSARFRQGLRILGDMGADNERALISPLCIGLLRAVGDHAALKAADAATRAWLDELSSDSEPISIKPPEELRAVLRDYQRRGVDWLMMLHRHRLTGILADDMGLGKTLQTLALLLLVRKQEGSKPSLVVAPTSVVGVWRDEAARFAPDLKLALWYGPPEMRRHLDPAGADLIVTSYGILRRDAERFAGMQFRYVILDEAQSAKNAASHNAAAIRKLKSERRLALSGTPLENRPEELWSVFDFLAPGFLGSLRQFRKNYAAPISRGDTDNLGLLRLRLQPLILRRLKNEVAKELPDKVEQILRCDMGTAQRTLYDHIAGELRDSIRQKIARVGIQSAQLDILAALTRLRQICCDPSLLPVPPGTKVPPSAKLAMFEELMREALEAKRCVVVFSQFVTMQRRIIQIIENLGVKPLWLHGGSTGRDKIVANFQDPKGPPVIVVSLRAGGTGVTLTRADTVIHYDPWWNPAVERQATDRTHRLGQKKTVYVYKLICTRSIEDRVLQLAQQKEDLAEKLLGSEGGASAKKITQEEVLALLS